MRCPKCGYISFDHLDNCLKCNKEIKNAAEALHGTVFNVAAPNFLKFQPQEEAEPEEAVFGDEFDGEIVMEDPSLDILLDNDEEDDLAELSDLDDDDAFEVTELDDESEDDISIDFNQFEDAEIEEEAPEETEFSMDLPDELSDLSDLEPEDELEEASVPETAPEATEDDFDLDLSLDGLDDEPALAATEPVDEFPSIEDTELSLDDELLTLDDDEPAKEPKKQTSQNDDDDLNFDLDLGGLSLDK